MPHIDINPPKEVFETVSVLASDAVQEAHRSHWADTDHDGRLPENATVDWILDDSSGVGLDIEQTQLPAYINHRVSDFSARQNRRTSVTYRIAPDREQTPEYFRSLRETYEEYRSRTNIRENFMGDLMFHVGINIDLTEGEGVEIDFSMRYTAHGIQTPPPSEVFPNLQSKEQEQNSPEPVTTN